MVTNAHRVEVEVGADGPASATPSGAAAAAPPAGAVIEIVYNNTNINRLLSLGLPCFAILGLP
jgi:hypothetical protein